MFIEVRRLGLDMTAEEMVTACKSQHVVVVNLRGGAAWARGNSAAKRIAFSVAVAEHCTDREWLC